MICLSLAEKSFAQCLRAVKKTKLAEIRLDQTNFSDQQIKTLFAQRARLIATCRPGTMPPSQRQQRLLKAIQAGAAYVDLEVESRPHLLRAIKSQARRHGCQLILSYHNFKLTPPRAALLKIMAACFSRGADLAKIACRVHNQQDNARLLGLLDSKQPLIVIGMGAKGRVTRLMAPLLGACFTYGARSKEKQTAPGQLTAREIAQFYAHIKL